MLHYCKDCALAQASNGECPLFKVRPEEEQTACPKFQSELTRCTICGGTILDRPIIDTDEQGSYYLCGQCYAGLETCATCRYGGQCAFQTDASCQEPPFVMSQQRQGNMVVQQQIKNPARVEKTCAQGCVCYSPTLGCCRERGTCENYKIKGDR